MDQDKFQTVSNTAFLFLPMDLVNMDYDNFQSRLEVNDAWCFMDDRDKNRYIYRYITDKMNPEQKDECLYLHYCLRIRQRMSAAGEKTERSIRWNRRRGEFPGGNLLLPDPDGPSVHVPDRSEYPGDPDFFFEE